MTSVRNIRNIRSIRNTRIIRLAWKIKWMGLCVVVHIIVEWFVGPLGVAILTAIRVPPTELGTIIPHGFQERLPLSVKQKSQTSHLIKPPVAHCTSLLCQTSEQTYATQTHKNHYSKILRDRPCSKRQKHILKLWSFNAMDGATPLGATFLICLAFVDHHHI